MNIIDFLPTYKYIDSSSDYFDSYKNINLYDSIYRKKELYENKLSKSETLSIKRGEKFNHQKILSRFLSGYTPYDEILLFHFMGTGKSCTSVGVIEESKKSGNFKRALIVAPNKALLYNYIEELVLKCTDGKYEPEGINKITNPSERMRILKNSLKGFYSFKTYGELYNNIIQLKKIETSKKGTVKDINYLRDIYKNVIDKYSNMIIVLDEVHNIRPKKTTKLEDRLVYEEIKMLCILTRNRKIVAMTGTPMRDKPEEIASIMNLILPYELQFESEDSFKNTYIEEVKDKPSNIKKRKINELKEKLKGRVSVLQAMESDVPKIFNGEIIPNFTEKFKIYKSEMSKLQTNTYLDALNKDGGIDIANKSEIDDELSSGGIYNNSRQASLFIYPPIKEGELGLYGSEGFNYYMDTKNVTNLQKSKEKNVTKKSFNMKSSLKRILLEGTEGIKDEYERNNVILKNIGKYSCIYKEVIKDILNNKDKCTYVYSESVTGSGAILLSKLLELVGFSKANGNEKDKGRRYAILTSETSSNTDIINIKKLMNNANNINAEYIQVIIGSDTTTEGFSLYNIQREHILTPFWNYTKIDQAIARGIRMGSHELLKKAGINPKVDIFQHASFPRKYIDLSIQLKMYKFSELKDVSIKRLQRILKESSVDCGFNYNRNKGNTDNSRECEYQDCEYKCDGISKYNLNPEDIDISTFNLYYSEQNINLIINELEKLFKVNFNINIKELKQIFSDFSDFQIISSMQRIISENIVLKNKYGIDCYLKEEQGNYFISNNITEKDNIISLNYTKNPTIIKEKDFTSELENIQNDLYIMYLDIMNNDISKTDEIMLLLEPTIKEELLEKSILAEYSNIKETKSLQDKIKYNLRNYLEYKGDNTIISNLLEKETGKKRCFDIIKKEWSDCTEKYDVSDTDLFDRIREILEPSVDGSIKYYGIISIKNNEEIFKIAYTSEKETTDKRIKSTGQNCKTASKDKLKPYVEYLNKLFEERGDSENIINLQDKKLTTQNICSLIKNSMIKLGLLFNESDILKYKDQSI
jgi:hypothetical protein